MQNDKLLPCPFCGGEAFVDIHKFWDENAKDFTVQTYGVACHQCGAKSWQHSRTEEDAIKQWNTRKPMERIVKQLEAEKEATYNRCIKGMYDAMFKDFIGIVSKGGKE